MTMGDYGKDEVMTSSSTNQQYDDVSSLRSVLASPASNSSEHRRLTSAKAKKRVSFPSDDANLVAIREIPRECDSPMYEELEPCDPGKLFEDMKITDTFSKAKYSFSKPNNNRSIDIVAKITGMNAYGTFTKNRNQQKQIGSLSQYSGKTPKSTATSLSNISLKSFDSSDRNDHRKNVNKRRDTFKRIKSADDLESLKNKTHKVVERKPSSAGKNRTPNHMDNYSGAKAKSIQQGPFRDGIRASNIGIPTVSISRTKGTINLNVKGLHVGGQLYAHSSQNRLIQSPYRNSKSNDYNYVSKSSSIFLPKTEIINKAHAVSINKPLAQFSKSEPNLTKLAGVTRVGSTKTQRYYAWHMANNQSQTLPELETPCISPMWSVKSTEHLDTLTTPT